MRDRGPDTLAALKRYLADGGTLTLTEATGLPVHRYLNATRTAPDARPGSDRVRLEPGGSYLTFGPAGDWSFDPDASTATVTDDPGESWAVSMTYRLGDRLKVAEADELTYVPLEEGAAYYIEYMAASGHPAGIYGLARKSALSDRWTIEGHGTDEGVSVRVDADNVIEFHALAPEAAP